MMSFFFSFFFGLFLFFNTFHFLVSYVFDCFIHFWLFFFLTMKGDARRCYYKYICTWLVHISEPFQKDRVYFSPTWRMLKGQRSARSLIDRVHEIIVAWRNHLRRRDDLASPSASVIQWWGHIHVYTNTTHSLWNEIDHPIIIWYYYSLAVLGAYVVGLGLKHKRSDKIPFWQASQSKTPRLFMVYVNTCSVRALATPHISLKGHALLEKSFVCYFGVNISSLFFSHWIKLARNIVQL